MMQKLINDPDRFVDEVLEGLLLAHSDELRRTEDPRAVVRVDAPVTGKVAIATGGGSGHLPTFLGFVGPGLADGVAVGNVFASPSSDQMLAVMHAIDAGRGVLQVYGNYGGDSMNFGLAAELAEAEGMSVATVVCADDVASAPAGEESRRRGIAGIFFLYKVAGAAADRGDDLETVRELAQRAADSTRSIGVALAPCIVPASGRPTFELANGEMEIGMGIHGEPGVRRGPLETADRVADQLMDALFGDMTLDEGDEVDVLVNGLGATPVEELYLLFRRAQQRLAERGVRIHRSWVGEYATSLEMAGGSISLLRLDDELRTLMDAPAHSPFLVRR